MAFRLTLRAKQDLKKILYYSLREYGIDAADRYELLLITAIQEVSNKPLLTGSLSVQHRPGIRTYALTRSRSHLPKDLRVQNPGHKLVYRFTGDVVEILAIIGNTYPASRVPIPRQKS